MEKINQQLQKVLYACLFCIGVPLLLVFWTKQTNHIVHIPTPPLSYFGLLLTLVGGGLMLWAMLELWRKGKGLPMNAFPPQNYVVSGAYAIFRHPIYVGAILISFGLSLYLDSSSGLWLISPLFTLFIVAYVLGFERKIIKRHFQNQSENHRTFFDLPSDSLQSLHLKQKVSLLLTVFLPWLVIYEAFIYIGMTQDSFYTEIALDHAIPFLDWTILFYIALYPLAFLLPFILPTQEQARHFALQSYVGMALIFYCYLVLPAAVNYQPIENTTIFTQLIHLSRETDGATAALPSFHVFWALMVYRYYALSLPRYRSLSCLLTVAIVISCLTTKSHTIADVLFGIIAYYLSRFRLPVYQSLLTLCEKISNSWHEWRWGKVRLINHGFYAAIGGFCGFLTMGYFLPDQIWILYAIGVAGFVGAGLWAQWVEGSSMLLRPFGYYGSVLGVIFAVVLIALFSAINFWQLMAVAALAASPIQFWGRCRCLVQGCCHGKPTHIAGIRFFHPKSRVTKLAGWQGQNLYPTQFYSMLANFFTFFLLWRLTGLDTSAAFIAGMYLILNGTFRFIEESLRGEPQTPHFIGMPVYQWLALISILIGIAFTGIDSPPLIAGGLSPSLWLHAVIYFVIILCAYGLDFPDSNAKFSRLTQE
ncbi:MAG TPA: diacylglyceryl transferase [Pasteurellaceae bacterium]|nr:diacylglyceryl transferase [Pasteurellaceae bacterium]